MSLVSSIQDDWGRMLLDLVDELRALTSVSHDISLPQIVVVGQQSSGKSSVLRALSNIPFPRQQGLSTQFATEIVCRRDLSTSTRATIIPHSLPVDADRQRLLDEFAAVEANLDSEEDLISILERARTVMGLRPGEGYSHDRLHLEICSPTQDHLTIIDLPGLVSDKKKLQEVDNLVSKYLTGVQTIVLAVVSGRQDNDNQRVFEMYSSCSDRVVGVITTPDQVEWESPRGTEICELVLNRTHPIGLGWHMVRNLTSAEMAADPTLTQEAVEKDLFDRLANKPIWTSMAGIELGIGSLKTKLGLLLGTQIAVQIPEISKELTRALARYKQDLSLLGDERSTPLLQKKFLKVKARQLRDSVTRHLEGVPPKFELGTDSKTLRDAIRNANESFADDMINNGHTWKPLDSTSPGLVQLEATFRAHSATPYPVLQDSLFEFIYSEVYENPGMSLRGTVHPIWYGRIFLKQSLKWKDMVADHADKVCDIVETYMNSTVRACVDEETANRLLGNLIGPDLATRRERLHEKIRELLTPFQTEYPATLNRRYGRNLQEDIKALRLYEQNNAEEPVFILIGRHIWTRMTEYYDIAIQTLFDNVNSLGIENILLKDLNDILTPEVVVEMHDQQLEELVGEPPHIIEMRATLRAKVDDFERAQKLISEHLNIPRQSYNHTLQERHTHGMGQDSGRNQGFNGRIANRLTIHDFPSMSSLLPVLPTSALSTISDGSQVPAPAPGLASVSA